MLRRLAALLCLVCLSTGLLSAIAHDHATAGPQHATDHGCIHCAQALEAAPEPSAPESPFSAPAEAVSPRSAPYVASLLDPSHSGNAPPRLLRSC